MELLKKLYAIYSGSRKEEPMRKFILAWVKKNVKDAKVEVDKTGNVLVVRGESETYPCIVAHMDQVQYQYPAGYQVLSNGVIIEAMDVKTREHCGLGADDKNGIWIALKALKKYDVMKCAFFVNEESGFDGSRSIDMKFFDDARWVIQCDRKGFQDFIIHTNGVDVCNKKFMDACNLKSHRYEKCNGSATDIGVLKQRGLKVSAVNLSCGYYKAHSDNEYTVVPDLLNCQKLVHFMVERLVDVYPHENKVEAYKPRNYSGYHKPWTPGAFSVPSYDEIAKESIEHKMEADHRSKYQDYDDKKIEGIAKNYYNIYGKFYSVSLDFCNECVEQIIEGWRNEDYNEMYQLLRDSICDMYDQYCDDVARNTTGDDEYDDVFETPELTEEQDKQFILDVCAECVEECPLLSGEDVVYIFNVSFGTDYSYKNMKEEIADAMAQAKVEMEERQKQEAEAKRKAAEKKKMFFN